MRTLIWARMSVRKMLELHILTHRDRHQSDTMNNWKCHQPDRINLHSFWAFRKYFCIPWTSVKPKSAAIDVRSFAKWNNIMQIDFNFCCIHAQVEDWVLRPVNLLLAPFEQCGHRSYFPPFKWNNQEKCTFPNTHTSHRDSKRKMIFSLRSLVNKSARKITKTKPNFNSCDWWDFLTLH